MSNYADTAGILVRDPALFTELNRIWCVAVSFVHRFADYQAMQLYCRPRHTL